MRKTKLSGLIFACVVLVSTIFVMTPSYATTLSQPSVITGSQASLNGPRVNNLVFEMFLNTHSAFLAVNGGQANILDSPDKSLPDVQAAESNQNLNLNGTFAYTYAYVAFNTQSWPTSDVHFRRAIAYLLDMPAIEANVNYGGIFGFATHSFLPETLYGAYSTNAVRQYSFDLQSAMNELRQVSNLTYSNNQWVVSSTGQPLSVTLYTRTEFPNWQQVAQMIKTNAVSVNLTIAVQVVTHATALGILSSHDFSMYTGGNVATGTPVWLYNTFYDYHVIGGINNFMLFDNATLNSYLNTVETSNNQAAVLNATHDAQLVLSQQLPMIPWEFSNWEIPSLKTGWSGYTFIPGFSTWAQGPHLVDWTVLNAHETGLASGGTFKVALISPPNTLNPITTQFNYGWDVLNTIYDPALAIGPINETQITPWLVTNYAVSPFSGTTPHGYSIPGGQTLTMNFVQNATFQDNTRLTAADYNFSVWYEGYAGPRGPYASMAAISPVGGELPGLVDSQVSSSNPYQVTLYLNDTSLWDVYNAGNVWVLPMHIWDKISPSQVQSYDPTAAGTEIGSGPFVFQNWVKGATISLTRNQGYFKTPWWDYVTNITSSSNNFNTTITQGSTPVTNATVKLFIGSASAPIETVTLTGGTNGVYSGSIPTSQLVLNQPYEATVNATYVADGVQHDALQFSGISSTSNVNTSSSNNTPSGSNLIPIVVATAVIAVVVGGSLLFLRRRGRTNKPVG